MNTGINRLVQAVNFPLGLLGRGRAPVEASSSSDDEEEPQQTLEEDKIVDHHGKKNDGGASAATPSRDTVHVASTLTNMIRDQFQP